MRDRHVHCTCTNVGAHVHVHVSLICKTDKFTEGTGKKLFGCLVMHVLMRDEKEGRKKQGRSNKQQGKATQHTQGSYMYMYMYIHCSLKLLYMLGVLCYTLCFVICVTLLASSFLPNNIGANNIQYRNAI